MKRNRLAPLVLGVTMGFLVMSSGLGGETRAGAEPLADLAAAHRMHFALERSIDALQQRIRVLEAEQSDVEGRLAQERSGSPDAATDSPSP